MASAERPRARRRWPWALLAVLAPAVALRLFVFGTYAVTSPSMAPALRVGDHLMAWKQPVLDAPRPWDLALLGPEVDREVPADVDALVKRVASAPTHTAEFLSLRDGDVWVGAAPDALGLRRRPDALVDAQLRRVHRAVAPGAPWQAAGVAPRPGGGLLLAADGSPAALHFGRAVRDGDEHDPGHDVVHDTGLALELAAPFGDGQLRLRLREGADVYEARVRAAPDGWRVGLHHNLDGGELLAERHLPPLPAGRLRFLNVDDELRLDLEGHVLLRRPVAPAAELPPGTPLNNAPALELRAGRLELAALEVLRDQHYTDQGRYGTRGDGGFPVVEVPPGSVFLLGDDSARSRDSRHFGPVPRGALLGRPFALYAPADRRRWLDRRGL